MSARTDLKELLDAAIDLAAEHARLAQHEFHQATRAMLTATALLALVMPLAVAGWVLVNAALALTLNRWFTLELGFFLVAAANGGLALVLGLFAALGLRKLRLFAETADTVKATIRWARGLETDREQTRQAARLERGP